MPALRRGRQHLVAYIGVMGPQDGVDLAVRAAAHVVHDLGREDVAFTFMGAGDCYDDLVALRDELGLQDYLELPGRVPDETVLDVLSTAEVGLSPGPEEPAQRRLDDEQDAWSTWPSGCRSSPSTSKRPGCRPARPRPTSRAATWRRYAQAIVELLDDAEQREAMGQARTPPDRATSWAGRTSARPTSASTTSSSADTGCEADMCGVAGAFLQPDGTLGWYRR